MKTLAAQVYTYCYTDFKFFNQDTFDNHMLYSDLYLTERDGCRLII